MLLQGEHLHRNITPRMSSQLLAEKQAISEKIFSSNLDNFRRPNTHTFTTLEILADKQQSQRSHDKMQRGNARDMGCDYTQLDSRQSCSPSSYDRHPRAGRWAARYASPGCRLGGKGCSGVPVKGSRERPCTRRWPKQGCRVARVGVHARSSYRVVKRPWQGVQVATTRAVHASP